MMILKDKPNAAIPKRCKLAFGEREGIAVLQGNRPGGG
jgi:hypothetical protein